MTDLISRQAAIEAVHKSIYDFFDICDDDEESPMTYKDKLLLEVNKAITTQIKTMVSAQSVEAEPIKHGQWIFTPTTGRYRCSACGEADKTIPWGRPPFDYCPHCGARMNEVEKDEEA